MRIALLTLATPAVAAVGRLSGPGWRAYARRHGYDFLPFARTPDPARHPYWGKVRLLLDHLDGRYDWLFGPNRRAGDEPVPVVRLLNEQGYSEDIRCGQKLSRRQVSLRS